MADPLSLTAGIITIIGAVQTAVVSGSSIFAMLKDKQLMSDELLHLEQAVRAIKSLGSTSVKNDLQLLLQRASTMLYELNQTIVTHINNATGANVFCWLRKLRFATDMDRHGQKMHALNRTIAIALRVALLFFYLNVPGREGDPFKSIFGWYKLGLGRPLWKDVFWEPTKAKLIRKDKSPSGNVELQADAITLKQGEHRKGLSNNESRGKDSGVDLSSWLIVAQPERNTNGDVKMRPLSNDLKQQVQSALEGSTGATSPFRDAHCIVHCHGNSCNIYQKGIAAEHMQAIVDACHPDKLTFLLQFDPQGYGLSSGSPKEGSSTEPGLIQDGIVTVNLVLDRLKIAAHNVAILGHSLGTAVGAAVYEYFLLKQDIELAGLITSGSFTRSHELLKTFKALPYTLPYYILCFGCVPIMVFLFEDTWDTQTRLEKIVASGKTFKICLSHAHDDFNIWWYYSKRNYLAMRRAAGFSNGHKKILGIFASGDLGKPDEEKPGDQGEHCCAGHKYCLTNANSRLS
ncbi:MAG: hypothetical protein Q9162_006160 [Coniocarpon cinnabarinum]